MNSKLAPGGNNAGGGEKLGIVHCEREEWFNESLYIHYYDYKEDYQ